MVTLQDIDFAYTNAGLLFDDLNLELKSGCIYGLLGQNGAGKSTLLNLICGALFPHRGNINLFNYTNTRNKTVLQKVFLLTEEEMDYVISGNSYYKSYSSFYPQFDHEKFAAIIKEWNVNCMHRLSRLSHGERKKYFIAFALSTNCSLVLLDEPTNGLDIPSKAIFRRLIAGAVGANSTIVISSHQVRDLDGLIDPVIILNKGKIVLNQSIAAIEDKIVFGLSYTTPPPENLLYSMQVPAGYAYAAIRHDTSSYGTKTDLELLFQTVINNEIQIKRLFGAENE